VTNFDIRFTGGVEEVGDVHGEDAIDVSS
jgi:hypothetical protein